MRGIQGVATMSCAAAGRLRRKGLLISVLQGGWPWNVSLGVLCVALC